MTVLLDIFLVVAFLLTALAGFKNGFFRELFSILGLIGGVIAGMRLTGLALALLPGGIFQSQFATVLIFLLIFLVVFFALVFLGGLLAAIWEGKSPTGASRMIGMGVGALRGLVLAVVLAGALTLMAPRGSATLGASRVLPFLGPGVSMIGSILPADLSNRLREGWDSLPFGSPGGDGGEGVRIQVQLYRPSAGSPV